LLSFSRDLPIFLLGVGVVGAIAIAIAVVGVGVGVGVAVVGVGVDARHLIVDIILAICIAICIVGISIAISVSISIAISIAIVIAITIAVVGVALLNLNWGGRGYDVVRVHGGPVPGEEVVRVVSLLDECLHCRNRQFFLGCVVLVGVENTRHIFF